MDMIQYQIDMEKLFNKNQLIPRITKEFKDSELNFVKYFNEKGIDQDFGFALLVQMSLHKRTTLPVLVGILRKHFDGDVKRTAQELMKATVADLVDWNTTARQFIVKYDISRNVQDDLDRYQYPLPMVVEPRELRDNMDSGYFTSRSSVILRNNHHDDDLCLDYINKLNKVKFKIDAKTAHLIKNKWKNLDKPKPDEDRKEFQKRQKAFAKYDRTAKDVIDMLTVTDGEFYLTHKVDKRGRTYCQGYHVTYQGATWNKSVINFADEETING